MIGSAWRDRQGDVWTVGVDGLLWTPETRPFPPAYVEKKWGPLVPVPPDGSKPCECEEPDPMNKGLAPVDAWRRCVKCRLLIAP